MLMILLFVQNLDKTADSDTTFWDNADRTWESIQVMIPMAAFFSGLSAVLVLLSCICDAVKKSANVAMVSGILNFLAFAFVLVCFALALDSSQMKAEDWEDGTGVNAEVSWQGGMACAFLALLSLAFATVGGALWKMQTGCCG